MSEGKSALGRGLGHLLKSAEPPPASTQTGGQSSTVTPGMAALLRVDQAGKPASPPAAKSEPKPATADPGPTSTAPAAEVPFAKWMFRASLIFADLLLFGLAAWLILKGGHPLTWLQIALCILAVAMGAWLTCLGLWGESKRR